MRESEIISEEGVCVCERERGWDRESAGDNQSNVRFFVLLHFSQSSFLTTQFIYYYFFTLFLFLFILFCFYSITILYLFSLLFFISIFTIYFSLSGFTTGGGFSNIYETPYWQKNAIKGYFSQLQVQAKKENTPEYFCSYFCIFCPCQICYHHHCYY